MSADCMKKKYASAMEKIIKNAVSETRKLLETIIEELQAEVLRVKSENENLIIRCSQFEEVLKNRSVYRETGTSPEPFIIEKCDKAVQCDLVLQEAVIVEDEPVLFLLPDQEPQIDDQPNPLLENETQDSENSTPFSIVSEKESSNDSFLKIKDIQLNVAGEVDPKKPIFDHMSTTTNEDMSVDESSLEPQNIENSESLEIQNLSCESEHLSTISPAQDNIEEEYDTCYEISEMETPEEFQEEELDLSEKEVHIELAENEFTSLISQESQKELDEQTCFSLQEDMQVSQTEDGVNSEDSKTELLDCEASSLRDLSCFHETANLPNSLHLAGVEMAEVDVQTDQRCENSSEFNTSNVSATDTTNIVSEVQTLAPSENTISIDTLCDRPISQLKEKQVDGTGPPPFSESKQLCTETEAVTLQAVPIEGTPPNQAHNASQLGSSLSIQQRQRCTSVTLEDAMLLLDAVNQQKYKASSPKVVQTEDSPQDFNVDASQNNLALSATPAFPDELIDPEVTQANVCPEHIDIEGQQYDHKASAATPPPANASSTIEPATDHALLMLPKPDENEQVTQNSDGHVQTDNEVNEPDLTASTVASLPKPFSTSDPATEHTIPQITLSNPDTKIVEIYSHQTHIDTKSQQNDLAVSSATLLSKPSSTINPSTNHLFIKITSNVLTKTNTSPKALSPEELTAVVSAVRSTVNTNVKYTLANTTCGKKTLIAVPFSLQTVMKPHHKIIVIPRQCRATPTQSVTTKDNAIILKKKQITDLTTTTQTVISTAAVDPDATLGEDDTTDPQKRIVFCDNMDLHRQPASVSKTALSPAKTTALEMLSPPNITSSTVNPQCKNSVQVKLSRLPFPISTAESVLVSNISSNGSSKITVRNTVPSSLPIKAPTIFSKFLQDSEYPSKSQAQPLMDKLTKPNLTSAAFQRSGNTTLQACIVQSDKSIEEKHSSIIRLLPILSSDHSHPQLCMSKSQFLAQLEVSPVIQVSKKADSNGKDSKKAAFVARLRSHLKPRLQTIRKMQKTQARLENNISNLTGAIATESTDATCNSHQTSGPDYENMCDISDESGLPDNIQKDDAVSPGRSTVTKNVSDDGQVKRKSSAFSPKRDNLTAAATVKKLRLKKDEATNENYDKCLSQNIWVPSVTQPCLKTPTTKAATKGQVSSDSSTPIPVKILNSTTALMSCMRRREANRNAVDRKSFLCKFCRKEFHKKKDIEAHVQIHAGKKPFQCNFCERKFVRTVELTRHLKQHSERKFQCAFCGKAFIELNNLKRHSYIHTGEKPYACPHCPRTFTQSGHMRTHIKNAHKTVLAKKKTS